MHRKNLNRILGSLVVSTAVFSPVLSANENPFQLKAIASGTNLAEVVPPATPKAQMPMKGMEGRCGGKMKAMMDSDKDGKVSKEEYMKHHEHMFDMKDQNKDGVLDDSEMGPMKGMGGMQGMSPGGGKMGGMKGMAPGASKMEGMESGTDDSSKP